VPTLRLEQMQEVKKHNLLYYLFIGISTVQTVYFFFFARNLRPIADDYCMAFYAGLGFWGSFQAWYTTWISDVFAVLTNYFLVGLPLITVPYILASVITVFFAILMISILSSYLLVGKHNLKNVFTIFPVITISFLSFWISKTIITDDLNFIKLKNMILHWQNINSQYIFLSALMALILVTIIKKPIVTKSIWILVLLLGFLTGTFGVLIVLTSFSLLFIFFMYAAFLKDKNKLLRIFLFMAGLTSGLIFAYFSPGTQSRSKLLGNEDLVSSLDILYLFNWTFPAALIEWSGGFLQVGALVVLAFGIILGIFSQNLNSRISVRELSENMFIFFSLSLIAAILSQLSEAFAYEAFWHLAVPYLFIYIFLILSGYYLGNQIKNSAILNNGIVLAVGLGLVLGISGLNVYKASAEISERKELWQVGPAPVLGMSDIENKDDWVFSCWMGMKEYKGYPDRENF